MMVSKRNLLFQGTIFRFYVSFRGHIHFEVPAFSFLGWFVQFIFLLMIQRFDFDSQFGEVSLKSP